MPQTHLDTVIDNQSIKFRIKDRDNRTVKTATLSELHYALNALNSYKRPNTHIRSTDYEELKKIKKYLPFISKPSVNIAIAYELNSKHIERHPARLAIRTNQFQVAHAGCAPALVRYNPRSFNRSRPRNRITPKEANNQKNGALSSFAFFKEKNLIKQVLNKIVVEDTPMHIQAQAHEIVTNLDHFQLLLVALEQKELDAKLQMAEGIIDQITKLNILKNISDKIVAAKKKGTYLVTESLGGGDLGEELDV